MKPEHEKYILDNIGKKPVGEMAAALGIKEKLIRRFLEEERNAGKQKDFKSKIELRPADKNKNYLNIFAIAFICFVGIILYSNTFHNSFQFDDEFNITDNRSIKNLSNLSAIFNFLPTRFITNLSLAFNYHFSHLNVFGYHLSNLVIHLLASIMVWWLVILTLRTPSLKDEAISGHSGIIALFAGLVFVSHPIQTQGVTYIIQRAASLAALFYISSLAFYVKARLSRQSYYYILSFITLVLAMFTKEMTITLPLMILLYEFVFFKKEGEDVDWKRLMPFLATILIIPITMAITKCVNFGQMRLLTQESPGILPWDYLLTQFRVIVTYIRLLFIPINQNLDYDYSISRTLFDIPTLSSLILLAVILITAVKILPRYRLISFGVFWFLLALLPESSIIPIKDVIFEHRLYLPMAGYAIFLVSAVYYIFEKKGIKPVIIILSIAAISYSILTYNRNFVWKDEFTLWNDTIHKSPNKARPYNNQGKAYQDKGSLDQAISGYNKAIEINPKFVDAYYNRGNAYRDKGSLDQAISNYNKAIEIDPKYAKAYNNRGNAYLNKGSLDQAISDYNKAIEIDPKHAGAYYNQGKAYQDKGSLDQAISDYDKAIEIDPQYIKAYISRGNAHLNKGSLDQAISDYTKAIDIRPQYAEAYNNRAVAYYKKHEYANSWEDMHRARELGYKVRAEFIEDLRKASGREN